MLVITYREGDSIIITTPTGEKIKLTSDKRCKIKIDCPKSVEISRVDRKRGLLPVFNNKEKENG
jgi:sRNA-binding carbon storage regulator CsrA